MLLALFQFLKYILFVVGDFESGEEFFILFQEFFSFMVGFLIFDVADYSWDIGLVIGKCSKSNLP